MKKLIAMICLLGYTFILIKVIVLKQLPAIRIGHLHFHFGGTQEGAPNFVPFKTIFLYLFNSRNWLITTLNLVGNIAVFVPLGFLLTWVMPGVKGIQMLLLAVCTGIAIETTQASLRIGIFDIDDVLLNAFGMMIGFLVFKFLVRMRRPKLMKVVS